METPSPIARTVRGLSVKITRASPVAIACVDHLGLIVPFSSHLNLMGNLEID